MLNHMSNQDVKNLWRGGDSEGIIAIIEFIIGGIVSRMKFQIFRKLPPTTGYHCRFLTGIALTDSESLLVNTNL